MRKGLTFYLVLILILAFSFPVLSNDNYDDFDEAEPSAKYYDKAKVIRIKYVNGESFINRGYNEGVEEAVKNLSIFEGDSAETTDGRMEIYLGKLNYLRMDFDTSVKFVTVPELRRTKTTIHLRKGGIYLDITNLDDEKDIVIQTRDCGLFLLKEGLYRINVNENNRTEVFVFDGLAEVAGTDYSRVVRENQKTVMRDGSVLERPFYFYSTETDGFDSWNKERTDSQDHSRYSSSRYLNRGYEEYEYELTRSGRWEYNDEYHTHIWIPYNIGSHWRPYSHGRWVWHPVYGYVWTSCDSWDYFTHHYGRWHWSHMYGWYWLPGYRWSPAWVSWCGSSAFWGWTPLSYYNRPVIIINGRWHKRFRYKRGIPWRSRSMIVIRKNQLMSSRISKVRLKKRDYVKIKKKTFDYRGIGPKSNPVFKKVTVVNAKGKRLVYKKGGLLSYNKAKTSSGTTIYKRNRIPNRTLYKPVRGSSRSIKSKLYKYSAPKHNTGKSGTGIYKSGSSAVYKGSSLKSKSSTNKASGKTYRYKSPSTGSYSSPGTRKTKSSSTYTYKPYRPSSSKYKKKSSSSSASRSKTSSKTFSDYAPKSYSTPKYQYKSSSNRSKTYGSSYGSYKSKSGSKYKSSSSYSKPSKSYKSSSYKSSSSRSSSRSSYKSSSSSSRSRSSGLSSRSRSSSSSSRSSSSSKKKK